MHETMQGAFPHGYMNLSEVGMRKHKVKAEKLILPQRQNANLFMQQK
jgi:hypothetical protein